MGLHIPQISVTNTQIKVNLVPSLYAGTAAALATLGQPIPPSKNLHEKPSYSKIWKQKFKAMNPFHKKGDEPWVAAMLAFFLGQWGAHKFYQGNKTGGFIMLGITLSGWALIYLAYFLFVAAATAGRIEITSTIVLVLGIIFLAVTSIWALIDFIRLLIAM